MSTPTPRPAHTGRAPGATPSSTSSDSMEGVTPTATQYLAAPVKIKTPDSYDGDRRKLKSFLTHLDLYFGFNAHQFATPQDRVLYASSYLKGSAFDWFETYIRDFLDHQDQPTLMEEETRTIFNNYSEFVSKIKINFGDIDEERTAERHLQALTQKGSAANYAAEFRQYAARTEWDDAALTAIYYRGLKDLIKDDIARGERPEDLEDMISTAIRIDNRQYERRLEKGGQHRPVAHTP